MGSGSSGSNGAPSGQSNEPWAGAQPNILEAYKTLQGLYQTPFKDYPGSSFTPEDPASAEALQARYARASGGSDLTRGAQGYVGDVLGGNYLNSNPYIDATYNRAADAVTKRFNEATLPAIDTRFGGNGRLGGGAYNYALGRAGQGLAGELSGLATDIYGQNYARERGFQDNAARYAPALAEADYNDINQLGAVGAQKEARAQTELDDLIARFSFAQEEPWARTERYLSGLQGGGYNQSTVKRGHMDNGRTVWSDIGSVLAALA